MENVKRLDYLDISKGLGMIGVVWGHINSSGPLCTYFYFFHMPLFFIISGMLFRTDRQKSFGRFFAHKLKTLFVPYAIFSVATWLIWVLYNTVSHNEVESIWMPLLQTLIAQGSQDYLVHNTALWFVPCLMGVQCLYYFISKFPAWLNVAVCFSLAALNIVLVKYLGSSWSSLPWNMDTGLMALPYLCLGNVFVKYCGHKETFDFVNKKKPAFLLIAVAITVYLAYSCFHNPKISMGHSYYGESIPAFYFRAIAGSAAVIITSLLLEGSDKVHKYFGRSYRYLKWFGRNSFDAMALNVPIKGVIIVFYSRMMGISQMDIWTNSCNSIVPFLLTMIIVTGVMVAIDIVRHSSKIKFLR